jgi:hypothetical protein
MVKEVWDGIKAKYRKPGSSGIYLEFKKILATDIVRIKVSCLLIVL